MDSKVAGSFRDPSGFVFDNDDGLFRQINLVYKTHYDFLIKSGLFKELVDEELLVNHSEVKTSSLPDKAYKIIQPDYIDFVSYPYEWSFSMFKDAALSTLETQRRSIEKGMTLKDASAYNIQFQNGKPLFIDTLSFEKYNEGEPWVAYKQFCQHFLAPLLLMAHVNVDLSKLLRVYIDGVPLELASKLLPNSLRLRPMISSHIFLHARAQAKHAHDGEKQSSERKSRKVSKNAMLGIVSSLASIIGKLEWNPNNTEWGDYYTFTNYTDSSFAQKKTIIDKYIKEVSPQSVWDVGANNGLFSRIASNKDIPTIAFDIDPVAVEKNYRQVLTDGEKTMLPLVMDLTNPSPSIGWDNNERSSMTKRGPADLVIALALIHHLSISNNVPFTELADYFSKICKYLVIEFVPKGDSQVNILLATREDVFDNYNEKGFEKAFSSKFDTVHRKKIKNSERAVYLLRKK